MFPTYIFFETRYIQVSCTILVFVVYDYRKFNRLSRVVRIEIFTTTRNRVVKKKKKNELRSRGYLRTRRENVNRFYNKFVYTKGKSIGHSYNLLLLSTHFVVAWVSSFVFLRIKDYVNQRSLIEIIFDLLRKNNNGEELGTNCETDK